MYIKYSVKETHLPDGSYDFDLASVKLQICNELPSEQLIISTFFDVCKELYYTVEHSGFDTRFAYYFPISAINREAATKLIENPICLSLITMLNMMDQNIDHNTFQNVLNL